ncbi:hypothetical protein [Lonepinella sp. MS14435]|uniref:hypothetical protein n=1 Tax=Lonepinella sp. MS14435 TaxID=3003618 RepID=UPI0036DB39A9
MYNIKTYVDSKFLIDSDKREISFKYDINDMHLSSYLYIKNNTNKLFVVLNGALGNNRTTALTYQRYSWHPLFSGSVLYIADPTLFKYDLLSLGWYMGDKYTPIYPYLVDFILAVCENLKLQPSNVILYGSSGGGFSALQLASYIGNKALAVAINPQTNIIEYPYNHRDNFLAQCFSASKNDYEMLSSNRHFNAIENIKMNNTKILYIQNDLDTFHVKHHFYPLIEAMDIQHWKKTFTIDEENKSNIQILWYSHESGHAAEPKESLPEIMTAIDYMV